MTFASPQSDTCPSWMPWDANGWRENREEWCQQLDEVLNVENYLRRFFHVEERLESAAEDVASFEEGNECHGTFASHDAAQCWQLRVQQWVKNLQADIRADSVPAPGDPSQRWLLYATDALQQDSSGDIECFLCRRCKDALGRTDSKNRPDVKMPAEARANGMWHGPDPVALQNLTYTECKVINLAKVYVSVK